ncbi:MAG UNVERIFIED_CONTAM: hypothetical protein LVR18_33120 [Planctomycetaceae bacterium]
MVERICFDAMDQLSRLSAGWNEIEIASRSMKPGRHFQDSLGENIGAAEVIEQPAIKTELFQGRLNRGKIKHGTDPVAERTMGV